MTRPLTVYFGIWKPGSNRKEFTVVGGNNGRFRPCTERSSIGDCDRLVLYDVETASLQIRTVEGVRSRENEPLGHLIVTGEVAL